jgi:sucrose phosphorylase
MKNMVQLITYVDRLTGGCIKDLNELLSGPFNGIFGGVHILPFFYAYDGADTGFDPIDHTQVDPRLGIWEDIKAISERRDVIVDLIVNHISSSSEQYKDWLEKSDQSDYADMFITLDKVFPKGANTKTLLDIYRPRPNLPFTVVTRKDFSKEIVWTTFTPQQIDIDVEHPLGRTYLSQVMKIFSENGVKMLRLDAIGYAIKRAGTSCFMIPETFQYIDDLTCEAKSLGMEVLVEVHSYYKTQIQIAKHVDWVYDFALPPLILQALFSKNSVALKKWLSISPRNAITVLDTHDGIGVIDIGADTIDPSQPGLVEPEIINNLVEKIHIKSGGISRKATGASESNLDIYQVNCSFYDALGRDDNDYLLARLIQFFSPGIPQVYYMGFLAGKNHVALFNKTNSGRDLNRRKYTRKQVEQDLNKPVVQLLIRLMKFRNTHPAFNGEFSMFESSDDELKVCWRNENEYAKLSIDFPANKFIVDSCQDGKTSVIDKFENFNSV